MHQSQKRVFREKHQHKQHSSNFRKVGTGWHQTIKSQQTKLIANSAQVQKQQQASWQFQPMQSGMAY
jgi:hypothetical protein